jgi:hypothetical protein
MKRSLFILFAFIVISCLPAKAYIIMGGPLAPNTKQVSKAIAIQIESVDFRDDVTRVYCIIKGQPHVSNRIDWASITQGTKTYKATDIDGIDFKRYFQWEDSGEIHLEVDFPKMNDKSDFTFTLRSIYGEYKTEYKNK